MEKEILPPSKRKVILFDELRKYIAKGYKLTVQKNFSGTLSCGEMIEESHAYYVPAKNTRIEMFENWVLKLFKKSSTREVKYVQRLTESKLNPPRHILISIDIYGEISVEEIKEAI